MGKHRSGRWRRKLVLSVAAVGVLGVAGVAWSCWDSITAWYEFQQVFESLGPNAQGCAEFRHRQTDIVMIRVGGGVYRMGSPEEEEGGWPNERPCHEVTLDPFLIAKYEVSQAEWRKVMGANPAKFQGDSRPVENVSWHDGRDFGDRTGLSLPSEAQWEHACRAQGDAAFAFGETISAEQANYNAKYPYGDGPRGPYRRTTVAVGSFEPNAFGLHDTHGNVAEWCVDVFDEDFYSKPEARGRNPVSTSGGGNRVIRGGGWFHRARYCRSASRTFDDPSSRQSSVGLRPVWTRS